MEYIGEHLFAGNLGRFFVVLSFTSALLSAFAYIKYWGKSENASWKKLARSSYIIHGLSVFGIVGTLFFMMLNHYYEYHYVWSHSSTDLEWQYMFSSFWEGQEGSFLLWMFWHAILGFVVMFSAKKWEAGSMMTINLVQAFLSSMLLGVYIGSLKLGQSPFILIRELPDYIGLPWTTLSTYLQDIPAFQDGRGLNPLLKNYWMTIHPPTLFLGFASVTIPFAFAITGLINKDHKGWIKPALPWAFFSIGILGIGILMGGAWAYEALSFGGFWAWDPVENASLVPWLVLVGAAHVMLVQRNRGGSPHSVYLLTLLAFILILYSTFLTRSGILGDTSVHSFVDLGLSGQLLIYLLFFIGFSLALYFFRFKSINALSSEEGFTSREFWMFIGSMVLLLSALQITFSTSMPVWNALFGPDGWIKMASTTMSAPKEPIEHYNRFQLPFAIVIAILIAFGQFLNYRGTSKAIFLKRAGLSFVVSIVVTILVSIGMEFTNPLYILLLFTSIWAVLANLDFWLRIGKGMRGVTGASVAHFGLGLILVGTLISQAKQKVITSNNEFIAENISQDENLILHKNDTASMENLRVQWFDEYTEGDNVYFPLRFWEGNDKEVSFVLEPFIQQNEEMGQVREPSTKHYWHKDIYTHLNYYDSRDSSERFSNWQRKTEIKMSPEQEDILYRQFMISLDSVIVYSLDTEGERFLGAKIGAALRITDMTGTVHTAIPTYSLTPQGETRVDAEIEEFGLRFRFEEANAEDKQVVLTSWYYQEEPEDFIIVKAIVFPFINLLWLGSILMGVGSFIAVYQRISQGKQAA